LHTSISKPKFDSTAKLRKEKDEPEMEDDQINDMLEVGGA
jgi:hypothetical protein